MDFICFPLGPSFSNAQISDLQRLRPGSRTLEISASVFVRLLWFGCCCLRRIMWGFELSGCNICTWIVNLIL
ncbi:hypothetical protein RchiOBHm_Chr2g0105641 [Rosa chinensis]|uniref:Uncharacterized protein n=1 Tax=Rosa chinensis TaxID=74649 RepID=A0A2P6RNG1_ROSCH|nr:hypothetical protein RchiOBHm_Chr2g0105641 [Rosa chinensis]